MLKLMGKKIFTIKRSKILFIKICELSVTDGCMHSLSTGKLMPMNSVDSNKKNCCYITEKML